MKKIIIAVLVLFAFVAIFSDNKKDKFDLHTIKFDKSMNATNYKEKEIYIASSTEIKNRYEINEIEFDEKLKGKLILVYGTVDSIAKSAFDGLVVHLKTDNQFMPASMSLDDSEKSVASTLRKNNNVSILCERMKFFIGSPSGSNCIIYTVKK